MVKIFSVFVNESVSLEYHKTLNQQLFSGDKLQESIRQRLLQIALLWQKFSAIPDDAVKDIIATGGNMNFNYTPESDIDVHILIDTEKLDGLSGSFLTDYFMAKKDLWAIRHPNLKICSYPVELYAQDYTEDVPTEQGSYSIKRNKWIQEPKYDSKHEVIDDPMLEIKIQDYKRQIDNILALPVNTEDESMVAVSSAKELKSKLGAMRADAIHQSGEFAFPNLIFKALRNDGYIDKLNTFVLNTQDHILSL